MVLKQWGSHLDKNGFIFHHSKQKKKRKLKSPLSKISRHKSNRKRNYL